MGGVFILALQMHSEKDSFISKLLLQCIIKFAQMLYTSHIP